MATENIDIIVELNNSYEDGVATEKLETVAVSTESIPAAGADDEVMDDWMAEVFLPLTGEGRDPSIHAMYEARITCVSDQAYDYLIGAAISAEG